MAPAASGASSAGGFGFGAAPSTGATGAAGKRVGDTSAGTAPAFGAPVTGGAPSFGSAAAPAAGTGVGFGASTGTSTGAGFGAAPPAAGGALSFGGATGAAASKPAATGSGAGADGKGILAAGSAPVAAKGLFRAIPLDSEVQKVVEGWHKDLEQLSAEFYKSVEEMTYWDKIIFKNNETIYGLQQQLAVMRRLQGDARHSVDLLDRDQDQVETLLNELEASLDASETGRARQPSSAAAQTFESIGTAKKEYEDINGRIEAMVGTDPLLRLSLFAYRQMLMTARDVSGWNTDEARREQQVREIRAARDLNADMSNPMSQLEMKLSEGFDALKDCDAYLERLAGNLSVCEAQLDHRRRGLGVGGGFSGSGMSGFNGY